jgi:hypothetical protein
MLNLFLNPSDVIRVIKQAEREDEVVVVRCVRKGPATKPGGPDVGDLYDLHCGQKPRDYVPVGGRDRRAEDESNGVLTVLATNRKNRQGHFGEWRRVNIQQVKKLIYKGNEYEVVAH